MMTLAVTGLVRADVVDRPSGIKIGQRMTLRPYVALSYNYDSNIDRSRHSRSGSSWIVNPGIGLEYRGENWQVTGRAWYRYHAYNHYTRQLDTSSYGESLSYSWANSSPLEKGWSLVLTESYSREVQDDDMSDSDGRGIWRDRKTCQVSGVLERRINEYWHAAAQGNYYYLDYELDKRAYAPLYGWERTTAGGEIGFAPSKWTDFLLAASYQWYQCDNCKNIYNYGRNYSRESRGFSVMGGIGSRATERISYRLLTGWSRFEFAEGADSIDGWTYQLSSDWKISDTWSTMAMASSYYQPSEREYGSSIRVDLVSWGLAHSMVRGKLHSTFDLCFRREDHVYSFNGHAGDYTDNYLTARLGLNYTLNRFLQVYGRLEYQVDMCEGGDAGRHDYDYDRYRGTIGLRLTY